MLFRSLVPVGKEINRDSPSSGERTGISPNLSSASLQALLERGCRSGQLFLQEQHEVTNVSGSGRTWEGPAKRVIPPYTKPQTLRIGT